jgi:hypothetical protein
MLICKKCGSDNPLGRIFCGSCGSKLDMSDMTSDTLADRQRESFLLTHYKKMLLVLAILVLATIGLALWPSTAVLGEEGTSLGSSKVKQHMGLLLNLAPGQVVKLTVNEKDINGYLKHTKLRKSRYESCSTRLVSRGMSARLVRPLADVPLGKFKLKLKISFDLRCVPAAGQVVVTGASVGHLPLWGPTKTLALTEYRKLFASGKEQGLLKVLTDIRIEDGQAELSAGE